MYLSSALPTHSAVCCNHSSAALSNVDFNQQLPQPILREVETIVAKAPLKADTVAMTSQPLSKESTPVTGNKKQSILTGIELKDFVNPKYGIGQKSGLAFIALYQKLTRKLDAEGNLKSKHGLCCRFDPSCSMYTAQAIKEKGLIKGVMMGAYRMTFECNPVQPVTKEFGLFKGTQMTAKAVVSEVLGMFGLNIFVNDRENVRQILQRVAEGQKTVAPVK